MKVIKNIIFVAIVFLISIGLLVVGNGYEIGRASCRERV